MLINDLQTWQEYCRVNLELQSGKLRYDSDIPAEIRTLFDRESILTPGDLSHDLLKEMFIESCKKNTPDFVVDINNEPAINLLIQYLRRDERFLKANPGYSFKKGLLLRGNIGTGKTALFRGLKDLMCRLRFYTIRDWHYSSSPSNAFIMIGSNEIAEAFCIDGYLIYTKDNNRKTNFIELIHQPLLIDDIGSEGASCHFGMTVNIIAELLIRRYDRRELTHATSNLDNDSLKSLYGIRVLDRMKEMFNDILLKGESRRK